MSFGAFGERFAGPVDRVPGRCYVVTRVFHINNFPLVPLGGLLVMEGSEKKTFVSGITECRAIAIPLSVKSYAWALVRVAMFMGGLLSFLGTSAMLLDVRGPLAFVIGPPLGIALLVTWWKTRNGFAASPERANQLLALLNGGTAQLPPMAIVHRR